MDGAALRLPRQVDCSVDALGFVGDGELVARRAAASAPAPRPDGGGGHPGAGGEAGRR